MKKILVLSVLLLFLVSSFTFAYIVNNYETRLNELQEARAHLDGAIENLELKTEQELKELLLYIDGLDETIFTEVSWQRLMDTKEQVLKVLAGIHIEEVINTDITCVPGYTFERTSQDYIGKDVEVIFNLCEYNFSSLSGNNITEDDYVYADGVLTIYQTYVDRILEAQPDRKMLILAFVIARDDRMHTVIGYIFIKTQTT
jgi:hypothetical protein